jgi:hypothetical protein
VACVLKDEGRNHKVNVWFLGVSNSTVEQEWTSVRAPACREHRSTCLGATNNEDHDRDDEIDS